MAATRILPSSELPAWYKPTTHQCMPKPRSEHSSIRRMWITLKPSEKVEYIQKLAENPNNLKAIIHKLYSSGTFTEKDKALLQFLKPETAQLIRDTLAEKHSQVTAPPLTQRGSEVKIKLAQSSVSTPSSFQRYLEKMETGSSWMGELELDALAKALSKETGCQIYLQVKEENPTRTTQYGNQGKPGQEDLVIKLKLSGAHFTLDSIKPVGENEFKSAKLNPIGGGHCGFAAIACALMLAENYNPKKPMQFEADEMQRTQRDRENLEMIVNTMVKPLREKTVTYMSTHKSEYKPRFRLQALVGGGYR